MIYKYWPIIYTEILKRSRNVNSILDQVFLKKCIKYLKESYSILSIERILEIGIVKFFLERLNQLNCLHDTCSHLDHNHEETPCDLHKTDDICNVHKSIKRSELKNKKKKLKIEDNDMKYVDNYYCHGSFNKSIDRYKLNVLCQHLSTIEDSDCEISKSCYCYDLSNIPTATTRNKVKNIANNTDLALNSDSNNESNDSIDKSKFYTHIFTFVDKYLIMNKSKCDNFNRINEVTDKIPSKQFNKGFLKQHSVYQMLEYDNNSESRFISDYNTNHDFSKITENDDLKLFFNSSQNASEFSFQNISDDRMFDECLDKNRSFSDSFDKAISICSEDFYSRSNNFHDDIRPNPNDPLSSLYKL